MKLLKVYILYNYLIYHIQGSIALRRKSKLVEILISMHAHNNAGKWDVK